MRNLYMVGMSHKVAPIAIREKFYIPMDIKIQALKSKPFNELVILATCNRTEIYVASDTVLSESHLIAYLCELVHQNKKDYEQFFYTRASNGVVHHVMNVCAGLDSVAMGEDQILHQIGRAYETAHQLNATGPCLNKLFQGAITTTKRIKTETNLSKLSCNIPFLAMKQVQQVFDDLENRTVYIVGLGEMGSLMLKYMEEYTTKIIASSKTFANAKKYADVLTPIPFENRYEIIKTCDIIILCSACSEPIFRKELFSAHITGEKKLLVIDLGNPRNAEASIGNLPLVQYVCVDDLEQIVSQNRKLRMIELVAAQEILKKGTEEFLQWYQMDECSKQIHLYADKIVNSATEESKKLLNSMPYLSKEDRGRIEKMYERFAKKIANDFLYKVKSKNPPEKVKIFLECLGNENE